MTARGTNGAMHTGVDRMIDLTRRGRVEVAAALPAQRGAPPPGQPAEAADSVLALLRSQSDALRRLADAVVGLEDTVAQLQRGARQALEGGAVEDDYEALLVRLRATCGWLPTDATVLVVSRGDERMLMLGERRFWHFPRGADGGWPGSYPATSQAAVVHLEALRAQGATHLLVPTWATWWLEDYPGFGQHLATHYTRLFDDPSTGVAFGLQPRGHLRGAPTSLAEVVEETARRTGAEPVVLDWTAGRLQGAVAGATVFCPPDDGPRLAYVDDSVDVVAVASADQLSEARRVATTAVVEVGEKDAVSYWRAPTTGAAALQPTSIIIPTYNGSSHVRTCLWALAQTLPSDAQVEVLVVDDGGADETPSVVAAARAADDRVRLVRSPQNGGFIDACHRGAAAADGDVLLFLNNDTIPLPGWLEPLLETLRDDPAAGAVGGKLVFPDGTLQEAGGVLYRDASGANFGKWDLAPDDPLYSYARPVDYCSGALLATPVDLWRELGGFDRRYTPAYYEDADYCFAVWAAGRSVVYQPESVVVHLEGATAGRDESSGMKRYQVLNKEKFAGKWSSVLSARPGPPQEYTKAVWHQLAVRGAHPLTGSSAARDGGAS